MYCCENCFCDSFLRRTITSIGERNDCSFCGSTNVFCVKPAKIEGFFRPLIDLYSPIEKISQPNLDLSGYSGYQIWEKIHVDWGIFNDSLVINRSDLLKAILFYPIQNGTCEITDSHCEIPFQFYGFEDEEAKKLETDWIDFTDEVRLKNRFFPSIELDLDRLNNLFQYVIKPIEPGDMFFRSRKSDNAELIPAHHMGKPPPEKACSGRANPFGISYLYLASDINTAIEEIRPSINDHITVGRFQLKETIRIVDLRDISPFQFAQDEDFESIVYKIGYLKKLGSDLSKPINAKNADLDYLPTQYLCEFIKKSGWGGVAYKSYLGDGYNIALYSDENIECDETDLYRIEKSFHTWSKIGTEI